MRPKKRLGQHFLHHRAILQRIADALGPVAGRIVVEIGPGQGALTRLLVERGARVTAIEKDPELAALVQDREPGARVIPGDALAVDWREAAGAGPGDRILVAGNIPYNITSPLIDRALTPPRPEKVVFLVQKEVAERVAAAPSTREYGALSVGVQAVSRPERLFTVPAGAFHPAPKVDSALLRLTPLDRPLVEDDEVPGFRRMVVGLFGFRRKQLLRGLRELTGWPADRAESVLRTATLEPTARPETLAPSEFLALFRRLIDEGWAGD